MAQRPIVTRAGFLEGARLTLPLWPGLAVFGAAYGAAAAQKGFPLWQAAAASGLVYAGASQMVALEMWRWPLDLAAVVGMVTVTLFVNARMMLMGATLQPWLHGLPPARTALQLFFLTDANWLIGMRYRAGGGRDLGVLFGAGLALWPLWVGSTALGHLAGGLIGQPRAFGLDFILPALFAATLVPLWRGPRAALPWLVSGLSALVVQQLVEGYAFIVVGALAGVAVGAFLDDGQGGGQDGGRSPEQAR
jgi:predicted branched-subunit amino acid permease